MTVLFFKIKYVFISFNNGAKCKVVCQRRFPTLLFFTNYPFNYHKNKIRCVIKKKYKSIIRPFTVIEQNRVAVVRFKPSGVELFSTNLPIFATLLDALARVHRPSNFGAA